MIKKALWTTLLIAVAPGTLTLAQPPDYAVFPGDDRPRHERWQDDRLERMVEYLELSDAQASEWQAISEQQTEVIRERVESIKTLRQEFAELADQENPNLEQLGRVALDLHREMKTMRSSRGDLFTELEGVLTSEQAERLEALKTAREFSGRRGHRGLRGEGNRPDSD